MKLTTLTQALVLGGAVLGASSMGCALTSKADVVEIRYFSPEQVKPHLTGSDASSAPQPPAPNDALEVRLGRVSSGSNLRERIAFRDAAYELGYYEAWRWTERPETYVRRELGRAFYEEHGLHRVFNGSAPTVDVEVIAFDDLRLASGRAARVQLKAILSDDSGVLWEDTLTVDRPVSVEKPKIEDVVAAMAGALDAAAEQVTLKVQSALVARRASLASATPAATPPSTTTTTSVQATTTTPKK
ncbi:MAG: cholesterol transport system auxiliary component [Myxococcales bacterium]|nr:cholesterol transport system auxiliary component [Myxococcales bacterium]